MSGEQPGQGDAGRREQVEDLAPLLVHLAPAKLSATRKRLANSLETRALLEAGLELLRADLFDHTGPDLQTGTSQSELFASLSRERVVELARDRRLRGALPTEAQYRERWPHRSRFNEDLIAYLFRPEAHRERVANVDVFMSSLATTTTFGDLIQGVAAVEVESFLANPVFPLQLLLQVAMPKHERVRDHVAATYNELLPWWAATYEKVGNVYGFTLLPGRTYMDMALLFRAVIDGVLLQKLATGLTLTLSDGWEILPAAIVAMLPSLVDLPEQNWVARLPVGVHGSA